MPQLETHSYVSQLFWLVVTFVPLYFVLVRTALPRIRNTLEARQTRIDQDINRAAKLTEDAGTVRDAYEQELALARTKAQEQVRTVTEAAAAASSVRHEALSKQLASDLSAAEERIAAARQQAIGNIRGLAQDLAAAAAARVSGVQLDPPSMQSAVDTALEGQK